MNEFMNTHIIDILEENGVHLRELKIFMNKHELLDELRIKYNNETIKDVELLGNITQDYEDLIELRNRLKEGTDEDTTIYEDDHITLDHILDYMEILMTLIGMGEMK